MLLRRLAVIERPVAVLAFEFGVLAHHEDQSMSVQIKYVRFCVPLAHTNI